jgi:predicted transposase YbfD/YdcC
MQPKLTLLDTFKDIPDPRQLAKCEHRLVDLLVIAAATLLCGGEGFNDMELFARTRYDWLKTFLALPGGVPRHDTFNRLFQALDPQAFLDAFARWVASVRLPRAGEVVALDGKALRRAVRPGQSVRHLVSVWATENRLVLGQRLVDDKSNEITAVPELLRALDLAGCIVTADALHCQKTIAKEITEADAHFLLALKGNQGTVYQEVQAYLDDARARGAQELAMLETIDKDHGRVEVRRYGQSERIEWFADRKKWEGLRSVGVVEAERTVGGQTTVERRYYLSSLPLDVAAFARAVRGHWGIENQLHWCLDVVMGEDRSRARRGHAAQNLALVRKWALNRLRQERSRRASLRGQRLVAAWDPDYLRQLLTT